MLVAARLPTGHEETAIRMLVALRRPAAFVVLVVLAAVPALPAAAEDPPAPRSIDTACPSSIPSGAFSDVPSDSPHRRAIDCMASRGISGGTGGGHFSPADLVTRGQMASFVARMITAAGGTLPSSPPDAFSDDDGSVHEHSINQLAAVGVAQGLPGTQGYAPQRPVDRAQVAAFLVRALIHLDLTFSNHPPDYFTDDDGLVHELAINRLAMHGVATGSGGTYQPAASTRRDQMASFLARALDLALVS